MPRDRAKTPLSLREIGYEKCRKQDTRSHHRSRWGGDRICLNAPDEGRAGVSIAGWTLKADNIS